MGSFSEELSKLLPLTVTSDNNDQATVDIQTINANGTITVDLSAEGANVLRGKVVVNNTYDVQIRFLDSPGGTPLFDSAENVVQGQSGGTPTTFTQDAYSPYLRVVISETSGADGTVDASFSL